MSQQLVAPAAKLLAHVILRLTIRRAYGKQVAATPPRRPRHRIGRLESRISERSTPSRASGAPEPWKKFPKSPY
jgi:hypothetical protein